MLYFLLSFSSLVPIKRTMSLTKRAQFKPIFRMLFLVTLPSSCCYCQISDTVPCSALTVSITVCSYLFGYMGHFINLLIIFLNPVPDYPG